MSDAGTPLGMDLEVIRSEGKILIQPVRANEAIPDEVLKACAKKEI